MKTRLIYNNSLLSIHLAVLLFGLAGLFGKLILLPAVLIVLGRVIFASIFLGIIIRSRKSMKFALKEKKTLGQLIILGVLLAFHWYTFFHSIQLSSVAIGLLTFSTFPLFTAFLEPWWFREKFEWIFVFLALFALTGILLIVPEFNIQNTITQGAVWGVLSGLSFAILTILNRKYVTHIHPLKISFYQDTFAALILLPFLFIYEIEIRWMDLYLLILLGVVFTAIAHFLYIRSLDKLNARMASIISSLEPVYGILVAWWVLSEIPTFRTIIGGMIILIAALYSGMIKNKNNQGQR